MFSQPKTQQFCSVSSWALSILGFLIFLNVLEKSHDKKTFSVQCDMLSYIFREILGKIIIIKIFPTGAGKVQYKFRTYASSSLQRTCGNNTLSSQMHFSSENRTDTNNS